MTTYRKSHMLCTHRQHFILQADTNSRCQPIVEESVILHLDVASGTLIVEVRLILIGPDSRWQPDRGEGESVHQRYIIHRQDLVTFQEFVIAAIHPIPPNRATAVSQI